MTNTPYILKRTFVMDRFVSQILLAATMLGIALLAIFDLVPEEVAQFAPVFLLVLFPVVWKRIACSCNLLKWSRA